MRPAEVVRRGAEYLARHDVESAQTSAEQLMMSVLGIDRAGVYARAEDLGAADAKAYGRALCLRCTGSPLQHLTGITGFRGLELVVRPGVFVPRPETEILVGVALEMLAGVEEPVVVDVGTGTGAVALAVKAERPDASVHATDASGDAIVLAGQNAGRLGLDVHVVQGDLLEALPAPIRPHLVVSNPPYVPLAEEAGLRPDVLAEPRDAVFGGPEIYRRLFQGAVSRLVAGGGVAVEIHEGAGSAISELARAVGFVDVEVRPDLAGRDRVVRAWRP